MANLYIHGDSYSYSTNSWHRSIGKNFSKFVNQALPGCSMQQIFRDVLDFMANSEIYDDSERRDWYYLIQLANPHVLELWEETYGICLFVQPDNTVFAYKDRERIVDIPTEIQERIDKKLEYIDVFRNDIYTPSVLYTEYVKNIVLLEKLIKYRSGYLDTMCFVSVDKESTPGGDIMLRGANHVSKAIGAGVLHTETFERILRDEIHNTDIDEFFTHSDNGPCLSNDGNQIIGKNLAKNIIIQRNWHTQ